MSVSEKVLDAIELLTANSVEKAGYDRTIQAQILSCQDATIGKYRCRYQDAIFYAYSNSTDISYSARSYVYILIPGNDMSRQKTILGTTKKLGINYISTAQGKQAYNIIGSNGVISSDIYYLDTNLNTYSYIIYDSDRDQNTVDIDVDSLERYIKQSSSLIAGATFKTNIPSNHQSNGHYGITFYLEFIDNTSSNKNVIRSYTIDQDNMVDNPYRLIYPTEQYQIFDIDGVNFVKLKSIQIFCEQFPESEGTSEQLLTSGDIQISELEIFGANRLTEEQLNGVAITFFTPQGNFFPQGSLSNAYRDIIAQVRVKGKLVSSEQKLSFYWGSENVGILSNSENYNKYLGRGWKCLNDKNIVTPATTTTDPVIEWIPSTDTYRLKINEATAKNNRFKVAVVYDENIITREINIQNLAKNITSLSIVSNSGVKFYHDIGHPILTCLVNGQEKLNYTYAWAKEDNTGNFVQLQTTTTENDTYNQAIADFSELQQAIENGTKFQNEESEELARLTSLINSFNFITRVEKNKLYDVQIRDITKFANFKCSVYNERNVYLGTASITLINSLQTEDLYSLVINNGTVGFKYNENGVAPNNKSLDMPQIIESLSFTIYDNLGNAIDNDIITRSTDCKIRWTFPLKNTLLVDSENNGNPGAGSTEEYSYFDNIPTLMYNIATRYDVKKQNNEIKLNVKFKGYNLTAVTNFTFTKDGDPGTNGTEFILKIVPRTKMPDPPLYPMITKVNDGGYYLNYGLDSTASETEISADSEYRLFNVELYQNGDLVWNNTGINIQNVQVTVSWSILANKYNQDYSDSSAFVISNATNGGIKYIEDHLQTDFSTPLANIIKCSVVYNGKTYYATMPIITAWVYNNDYRVYLKEYTGFRYVVYTSDGVLPSYDNTHPFEFICKEKINDFEEDISLLDKGTHRIRYNASVIGTVKSTFNGATSNSNNLTILTGTSARKGLNKNQFPVRPSARYNGECVNNALLCEFKREQDNTVIGKINVPIHLLLNKFGLDNINIWDGNSIQINADGGYILSPQMGAGTKDNNNRFTGVLMGQVKIPGKQDSDKGLLGYHQGERSFFLSSTNGSGIFGKAGKGQIIVDPTQNQALLYSGNFWTTYDTSTGLPASYNASNYKGEGLLIDLTTPQIIFGNGNFKVDSNGHLTAKGGGTIAKWKISDDHLTSDTNSITLHSNGTLYSGTHSTLASTDNGFYISSDGLSIGSKFKITADGSGTLYSESHSSLTSTNRGFYISSDGLSIGSKFKVTSEGILELGNGATASNSKHWVINGDTSRSYISYGDGSYDKYFIAANASTTNKNQVYIGTDGISLGRRFSVNAAGELICSGATVSGTISSTGGTFTNITASGGTFSNITASGGTFKNITASGGSFSGITASGGTFSGITASGGTFNNITASGNISSTGGTFTNISASGGTFSNISASGGTFTNISASGGTFSNINASGATINYLYYGSAYVSWQTVNVLTGITAEKVSINNTNVVQKLHRIYSSITFLCPSYTSWGEDDYS